MVLAEQLGGGSFVGGMCSLPYGFDICHYASMGVLVCVLIIVCPFRGI